MISATTVTLPNLDLLGIAAVIAALTVIGLALVRLSKFFRRANQFFEDWYGTPAAPGHEAVPGVLQRIGTLESSRASDWDTTTKTLSDMGADITEIKKQVGHELNRNGGSSTKDAAFLAHRTAVEALEVVKQVQEQQEHEIIARRDWHERYLADQQRMRAEWSAVFKGIRSMITLPPEEQLSMWDDIAESYADGTILDEGQLPLWTDDAEQSQP